MQIKKLTTKKPMVSLTADEGFYLARTGTPLAEVDESRERSVPEADIDKYAEYPIVEVEAAKAEAERVRRYEKRVVELIRERYSADDETAILRKFLALSSQPQTFADDKPAEIAGEFERYNAYAEQCKAKAREEG